MMSFRTTPSTLHLMSNDGDKESVHTNKLSNASETAISIMAVDDMFADQEDRARLARIDVGDLTHDEAINEVKVYAASLAKNNQVR